MDENEYPLKVHIYGPGTWKCMPAWWVGNGSVSVGTFQLAEPAASRADAPRETRSLFDGLTSSSSSLGPGRPVEPQAVPGGKPEEMPSKRRRLTDRLRARA